jgi:transposase
MRLILGCLALTECRQRQPDGRPITPRRCSRFIYGYLNRIQSSRRLEREAGRNIELMWLTGRLAPDFKTIASFHRDNGAGIRAVCSQFVILCRRLNLFARAVVAIDGSKFKAVNNRDKNYTVHKVAKRIEQADASIARYLAALDRADREESDIPQAKVTRLKDKIAGLHRQMEELKQMARQVEARQVEAIQVEAMPDKQVSLTDPDARSMSTSGRGTGMVGYNVQTAVDTEHHLIVAHEVTSLGHDRTQLEPMGLKALEVIGSPELAALADRGYYNGEQVLACEGTGVLPCIPKTIWPRDRGFFPRDDFVYDAENDQYTCPAGQKLTKGLVRSDRRDDMDHYRHLTACFTCSLKPSRTPDKLKRLKRWQHEDVLERMQVQLDQFPDAMGIRRQTVEYPFGTLKSWTGATHFLTRTLDKVRTEMRLHVLAYNFKRMIKLLGIGPLLIAIKA